MKFILPCFHFTFANFFFLGRCLFCYCANLLHILPCFHFTFSDFLFLISQPFPVWRCPDLVQYIIRQPCSKFLAILKEHTIYQLGHCPLKEVFKINEVIKLSWRAGQTNGIVLRQDSTESKVSCYGYPFSTAWRASFDTFAFEKCWKIFFTRADGILGPDAFLLRLGKKITTL